MAFLNNYTKYPRITKLINSGGQLDIGYIQELDSFIVASNKRDIVWEGRNTYESLEDALEHAEKEIKKLYDTNGLTA